LSRQLVRLDREVPVPIDWEAGRAGRIDGPRLVALFRRFGFRSLVDRVERFSPGAAASQASLPAGAAHRGDRYEIRNAQDYFGEVVRGTYSGGAIRLFLLDKSVAKPIGCDAPPSTLPEFGVFVLTVSRTR
jgi:hypothetical protein